MEIRPVEHPLQRPSTEVGAITPATSERGSGAAQTGRRPVTAAVDGKDRVTISPEAARKSQDEQEKQQADELKATEEKVKAHEAAHMAAGGQLASGASYQYRTGPDGKAYITGGEVQIDLSPGKTPQETIRKMEQVIRAALAPSDPSAQDRAVAAQAATIMAEAQQELLRTSEEGTPAPAATTKAGSAATARGGTSTSSAEEENPMSPVDSLKRQEPSLIPLPFSTFA